MKKTFVALMCTILLSACSKETETEQKLHNDVGLNKQPTVTYRVTSYPYTPFVIRDGKGQVSGLETDILLAIAKKQNIHFEFMPLLVKWDLLFKSIEDKQSDLLSAGMYPNAERRQRFEVSKPYMDTQFAFLVAPNVRCNQFSDLKNKRLVVMANSIAAKEIQALPYSNEIKINWVNSIYEGVKAVVSGEADVLYGDKVVLGYYANQYSAEKLRVSSDPKAEKHQFVFLMSKGNTQLLEHINTGLSQIQADGTLDKIKKKWLENQAK